MSRHLTPLRMDRGTRRRCWASTSSSTLTPLWLTCLIPCACVKGPMGHPPLAYHISFYESLGVNICVAPVLKLPDSTFLLLSPSIATALTRTVDSCAIGVKPKTDAAATYASNGHEYFIFSSHNHKPTC